MVTIGHRRLLAQKRRGVENDGLQHGFAVREQMYFGAHKIDLPPGFEALSRSKVQLTHLEHDIMANLVHGLL